MHTFSLLSLNALISLGSAIPYQVSIASPESPLHSFWEKDDRSRIVPLSKYARNGSVNPVVEEGFISLVGPRFANVFYQDDNEAATGLGCWDCVTTVAKSVPCVFSATTGGHPEDILKCISKSDLCGCAGCLPGELGPVVSQICQNSAVLDVDEEERFSPYVDYAALSTSSLALSAFRGDLYKYQVEQIKALNAAHQSKAASQKDGDVHAMCVFGSPCGDCPCCLGGCAGSTCIGIC